MEGSHSQVHNDNGTNTTEADPGEKAWLVLELFHFMLPNTIPFTLLFYVT